MCRKFVVLNRKVAALILDVLGERETVGQHSSAVALGEWQEAD